AHHIDVAHRTLANVLRLSSSSRLPSVRTKTRGDRVSRELHAQPIRHSEWAPRRYPFATCDPLSCPLRANTSHIAASSTASRPCKSQTGQRARKAPVQYLRNVPWLGDATPNGQKSCRVLQS